MSDKRTTPPVIDNAKTQTEIISGMSEANIEMASKLGKALNQLRNNAAQFAFYEEQHRAKGTIDAEAKAEVNRGFVEANTNLIAELTASA